jgi:copper chaperone CopZ
MKTLCLICFFLSSIVSTKSVAHAITPYNSDSASLRTDTLMVHDMRCGQCETRIHRAIKKVAGISDSYADAQNGTVVVTYDPAVISREKIEAIIVKTGYGVGAVPGNPAARNDLPACCK